LESASTDSKARELERFFYSLYGDQTGYVYSPVKNPNTENFEKFYFNWPSEKDHLVKHIIKLYPTHEVYYSPALFLEAGDDVGKKETFKGTYFVWAEFDGTLPDNMEDIPEPTLKVQSSTEGHEHWYWKLDKFITDRTVVENISQRLAYHLSADLGCWNANRVLRPPGTLHHESSLTVSIIRQDTRPTTIADFAELPELPVKLLEEDDIKNIPLALKVISKFTWPDEAFDLFTANVEKGGGKGRSAALTKLGHFCIEMGMNNSETLSILLAADNRWKKFSRRKNQKKCLIDIINWVRARHPVDPIQEEIKPRLQVYTWEEFMNTEVDIEWLIEGILHKKGLFVMSGPPDIGKSQLSMRFAEKMAKGEKFLKWGTTRPIKTLLVSMEMPHEELKHILDVMDMRDPTGLLRENFHIVPLGHSVGLKTSKGQLELAEVMEAVKPDVVMLDSLGVAISDEISSDKVIFEAFNFVHKVLRGHFGASVWFIHHPRKEQIGNKKPTRLDDMYGSRYISAALTGAVNLWPVGTDIEISCLKMRLHEKFKAFRIRRTPGLDFMLAQDRIPTGASILGAAVKSDDDDMEIGGLGDSI
jgi:hypothetical protein